MGAHPVGRAAVACALLQGAVWYVGDGDVSSLGLQWVAIRVAAIHGLVALGYLIWPKKDPAGTSEGAAGRRPEKEGAHR